MLSVTENLGVAEDSHWVDRPQDESEASNRCVEGLRLAVLVGNSSAAIESQLVDHDQVGNTCPHIPTPGLAVLATEGSEQASQDHNHIGNDGDQDVSTTETSEKGQIQQEKWCSNSPINVSCPVDLSLVVLMCVWDSLVMDGLGVCVEASAIPGGHGEVGEECKGSDEGSQYVEKAFLLQPLAEASCRISPDVPLERGKPCHKRRERRWP